MSTNGVIKVRYISDDLSIEFEKGKIYEAHRCRNPKLIAFFNKDGDEYGYPAEKFEIIREEQRGSVD